MNNFIFIVCTVFCAHIASRNAYAMYIKNQQSTSKWTENEEIQIFREYLRIPTVQPNPDYRPAVEFLKRQAASLNLPVSVYYPVNDKNPVVVMTWKGSQPELPAIMLNSHMDVVPVFEEYWSHPPFAAEIDENGDIFARGAQDTKFIGTQYLAAVREFKRQGINQLKRTIHITFVPDEEAGGALGMAGFVKTDAFKQMNVAFALDEGDVASLNWSLPAYFTEKRLWQIEIIFHGQSGHGSKLFDNTPGEKLNYVVNKFFEYRAEKKKRMKTLNLPEGNVTSINLTILKGGVANNVIPAELSATFDIRVTLDTNVETLKNEMNHWFEQAGGNISINTLSLGIEQTPTRADDSNPFWVAFKKSATDAGITITPTIMGGASDMRFIRSLNIPIPAIGFSPMGNTITRNHDHDEYLNADVYLKGIKVYEKIIMSLSNVEDLHI